MTNEEMRAEIKEKLAKEMYVASAMAGNCTREIAEQEWEDKEVLDSEDYYLFATAALQASTDTCRMAVVRKEGEKPENPYGEKWAKAVRILQDSPINSQERKLAHIDKANSGSDMDIYTEAQADMLSAGYVQEVKNGA